MSAEQLLSMAMTVVAAEEVAREVSRGVKVEVSAGPQKPRETKIVRLVDVEPGMLILEKGSGRLDELVVVSDTNSYELTVIIDNVVTFTGPFSWYQSISQYSDWIDAFENDGTFILRLTDISFSSSLNIYFRTIISGIKLREVIAKIEKY